MKGIVVVLSGFPRRSETFALGELEALARAGLLQAVFATKRGDGLEPHEDAARLSGAVTYLPEADGRSQADALVHALNGRCPVGIHGYFAHRPAEVAQEAAARLGVPFGFSVHARDSRKVDAALLHARACAAACVVTCNDDARTTLESIGVTPRLIPHGVNLARFTPGHWTSGVPLQVLAVGRLVPKKGFDILLRALALVSTPWRLRIVGDGPQRESLEALAIELGIATWIDWHGVATHADLPSMYRAAHVVAVPSVVDKSGDRDGLPNVVLEALASGRAVVATRVGAIACAVHHEQTGWLVDPGDVSGLAARLDAVSADPVQVARVAAAGRDYAALHYEGAACAGRFVETLAACYA